MSGGRAGRFFMGRVDEWRKTREDGAVKEGNGNIECCNGNRMFP